jgi:hypothetical protein
MTAASESRQPAVTSSERQQRAAGEQQATETSRSPLMCWKCRCSSDECVVMSTVSFRWHPAARQLQHGHVATSSHVYGSRCAPACPYFDCKQPSSGLVSHNIQCMRASELDRESTLYDRPSFQRCSMGI